MSDALPIPTLRTAHVTPYIDLFRSLGVPVEKIIYEANIPTSIELIAEERPNARLPLRETSDFIQCLSRNRYVEDLGLRAATRLSINDWSSLYLAPVLSAPTLKAAIECFCQNTTIEADGVEAYLETSHSRARITSTHQVPFGWFGERLSEFRFNAMLVELVRAVTGHSLHPDVWAFRTNIPIGTYARRVYSDTRFLVGEPTTWIEFPANILEWPRRALPHTLAKIVAENDNHSTTRNGTMIDDFHRSLVEVIKTYLLDQEINIHGAAEIAGLSARTLQRRLKNIQMCYTAVVRQARYELAAELLVDPTQKIVDVASEVGFNDASHFSRAFRLLSGTSPREFRNNNCQLGPGP